MNIDFLNFNHEKYMELAIEEALKAKNCGEVPVGAVIIDADGNILSKAYNSPILLNDPTAHAEIIAIKKAGNVIKNYRLINTTIYVTIEPCIMCMGAIINSRIKRLVFGAHEPKWGSSGSIYDFPNDSRLNHSPEVIKGILENECKSIIKKFFDLRRKTKYSNKGIEKLD
ncbi:MAG: tRNA adenosine(34) deaminase TadA [Desulfobacterales bacterium]|nr:tRNA adenosine(34) deaminase TadA [Desulfobacterales bacterium]